MMRNSITLLSIWACVVVMSCCCSTADVPLLAHVVAERQTSTRKVQGGEEEEQDPTFVLFKNNRDNSDVNINGDNDQSNDDLLDNRPLRDDDTTENDNAAAATWTEENGEDAPSRREEDVQQPPQQGSSRLKRRRRRLRRKAIDQDNKRGHLDRRQGDFETEEAGSTDIFQPTTTNGKEFFSGAFMSSFLIILASELGDKTFFIAAIMSMRHGRLEIFVAAIAALAVMTILSTAIGNTLPNLLPRVYTHYASAFLFLFFGYKLVSDAWAMTSHTANLEELEEVEVELSEKKIEDKVVVDADVSLEEGRTGGKASADGANGKGAAAIPDVTETVTACLTAVLGKFASPVFVQCFTMTFLAEWGDRSQIATIALAASKDPYGVTIGGIIGHAICTGLACVGGKLLATRISEKMVAYVGGVLFFVFGVHAILVGAEE